MWPLDARYATAAPQGVVPSSLLNELQDRVVDLHRQREATFIAGAPQGVAGGSGREVAWELEDAAGVFYWACYVADKYLTIPLYLPEMVQVIEIRAKVLIQTAEGISCKLYKLEQSATGTGATTPPASTLVETRTPWASSPPEWHAPVFSGSVPFEVGDGELYVVRFETPNVADGVGGVRVIYEPITT